MAFTIGAWAKGHQAPFVVGVVGPSGVTPPGPSFHFELADQTANSAVMQVPVGIALARIVGVQKSMVVGTGTVGPIYELQVASDLAFTQNIRTITQFTTRRVTGVQSFMDMGFVPDLQTNAFARVQVTLNGTDTVVADFMIDFLPGA